MLVYDPRILPLRHAVRPPKVCIVQYNASKFLTRVDRAARTLVDEGYEVVLLGIKDDDTPETEERNGYTVRRVTLKSRALPRGFGLKFLRFAEGIWRMTVAAWSEDADIYNSRDAYPLFSAHVAAALRGARVVYDSDELNLDRNWAPSRNPVWRFFMKRYEGFFARRSEVVITSDYGRAAVLGERYGVDPVVVLNVPDLDQAPQGDSEWRSSVLGDDKYLLIYQGILLQNRGLPEMVAALEQLPEMRLAIIGYGPLRDELASTIDASPARERIALLEAVPFEKLMSYTASADIGVIPLVGSCLSYRLAAPNKLFEFMAAGLPVVATDLEEMARYVREERAGSLIAEPVTADSIADAVRRLLADQEGLAAIGKRNRETALSCYVWAVERPKLVAAFEGIPLRGDAKRREGGAVDA